MEASSVAQEKKYHINSKREVKPCQAEKRACRFAAASHFADEAQAQRAVEEMNAAESGEGNLHTSRVPTADTATEDAGNTVDNADEKSGHGILSTLEVTDEKRHGEETHYAELWAKDGTGVNTTYVKINRRMWNGRGADGKASFVDAVVLCDLEVNPTRTRQGAARDTLRMLKEEYDADVIYTTGTFSHVGYQFYQAMLAHEEETGERLLALKPGAPTPYPPREDEEYTFVADWDEQQSRYRL